MDCQFQFCVDILELLLQLLLVLDQALFTNFYRKSDSFLSLVVYILLDLWNVGLALGFIMTFLFDLVCAY